MEGCLGVGLTYGSGHQDKGDIENLVRKRQGAVTRSNQRTDLRKSLDFTTGTKIRHREGQVNSHVSSQRFRVYTSKGERILMCYRKRINNRF